MPLWTIAEQVYDSRADTPERAYEYRSPQADGHPIGIRRHHGAPDRGRLLTAGNGFVNGPAAQIRERVIRREAARIGGTECLLEACPEVRQPHARQRTHGQRDTAEAATFRSSTSPWYAVSRSSARSTADGWIVASAWISATGKSSGCWAEAGHGMS